MFLVVIKKGRRLIKSKFFRTRGKALEYFGFYMCEYKASLVENEVATAISKTGVTIELYERAK